MEQLLEYIKPELLIVAVVLYFLGSAMKKAAVIKDKYIPLLLGLAGIIICSAYVFAVCDCNSGSNIAMAVFTAVTQGILVAGLSTYVNQLSKQIRKEE
ncbi:MAG: phage holin family protein [Ruminococcus sp.]|jgi:hypothetical protein